MFSVRVDDVIDRVKFVSMVIFVDVLVNVVFLGCLCVNISGVICSLS